MVIYIGFTSCSASLRWWQWHSFIGLCVQCGTLLHRRKQRCHDFIKQSVYHTAKLNQFHECNLAFQNRLQRWVTNTNEITPKSLMLHLSATLSCCLLRVAVVRLIVSHHLLIKQNLISQLILYVNLRRFKLVNSHLFVGAFTDQLVATILVL